MSALAGREEELCNVFETENNDTKTEHNEYLNANKFTQERYEDLLKLIMKGRYYTQLHHCLVKADPQINAEIAKLDRSILKTMKYNAAQKPRITENIEMERQITSSDARARPSTYLPKIQRRHQMGPSPITDLPTSNNTQIPPSRNKQIRSNIHSRNTSQKHNDSQLFSMNESMNKSRQSMDLNLSDSFSDTELNKTSLLPKKRIRRRAKVTKARLEEKSRRFKLDVKPTSDFSRLFRTIGFISEKVYLANGRLPLEYLQNYLLQRYPEAISQKIIRYFDFPTYIDFSTYVKSIEALCNRDLEESYFLALCIYDFNNDGKICIEDLFELFKLTQEYRYLQRDFDKFFQFHATIAPPKESSELLKAAYRRKYDVLYQKKSHLTEDPPGEQKSVPKSNYTVRMEMDYLWKKAEAQRAAKRYVSTISSFRKSLAQQRVNGALPTNIITRNFTSIHHFLASSSRQTTAISNSNLKQSPQTRPLLDIPNRKESVVSVKDIKFQETWKHLKADVFKLLSVFNDDIPYIVYDVLCYMALVVFPEKRFPELPNKQF